MRNLVLSTANEHVSFLLFLKTNPFILNQRQYNQSDCLPELYCWSSSCSWWRRSEYHPQGQPMQRRQHGCSVTCWFTLTHSHAVILTSVWPFLGMWRLDGAWETWLFKSLCMWSEQYRRLLKTKVRCLAIEKHYQNNPKKHHHNIATGYQWACWECDNPHSPLWCSVAPFPSPFFSLAGGWEFS